MKALTSKSQKWEYQEDKIKKLHTAIDSRISDTFQTSESRNKLCIQKALLLKAYLSCRLQNWEEAEISSVDAFRFGQINKDPGVIAHSLVLLAFALKKRQRLERLEHILHNLLSSDLAQHSPELLFLVSIYQLDLGKHFSKASVNHLNMSQLFHFGFRTVLDQFSTSFSKKSNSDILFRTSCLQGSELISLSVLTSFSEDFWFEWFSIFSVRLRLMAPLLVYLSPQFEQTVFNWLFKTLQHNSEYFFSFLQILHKDAFVSSSGFLFLLIPRQWTHLLLPFETDYFASLGNWSLLFSSARCWSFHFPKDQIQQFESSYLEKRISPFQTSLAAGPTTCQEIWTH